MDRDKVPSNVALRSNITERENAWDLVPGDIVEGWEPSYLVVSSKQATDLQREEKMYYAPCAYCGRHIDRINLEGPVKACEGRPCFDNEQRR